MNKSLAVCAVLSAFVAFAPMLSFAQDATSPAAVDLQRQIDDNNAQIGQLDKEIAAYQTQLDSTTKQKNTLQNTINQLALQSKQLAAKIAVTKSQINTTQLQIKQLSGNISDTQASINTEHAGLAESLRRINERDKQPFALLMLVSSGASDIWHDIDTLATLQSALDTHVQALASKKQTLTDTKTAAEQKRAQLLKQQQTLVTQQGSLTATKKAQGDLLVQTRNQEAVYQSIIAQKKAQQAAAEADIYRLSQQLAAADTSKVPGSAHGILSWPLDSVRVTQYFGKTTDSGRLYASGTHNGIDFAANLGTPVRAALSGSIMEVNYITAAQDRRIGYCQYGSWVLIKHGNGLATLYAHLSQLSVTKGQTISTGQVTGYSGDTGYAIGPHLHFGVYNASSITFKNYTCTSGYSAYIPVAPTNGYLDPASYLPAL